MLGNDAFSSTVMDQAGDVHTSSRSGSATETFSKSRPAVDSAFAVFQDKDFGKQTLHKGHANPLAEVTTSLKTYQHFTLEKAYLGEDFFWAFTPVAGDFIRIRFFTPVRIERSVPAREMSAGRLQSFELIVCLSLVFRYFFRSGNIEHPGDKLFNTSVEVLPFDVSSQI